MPCSTLLHRSFGLRRGHLFAIAAMVLAAHSPALAQSAEKPKTPATKEQAMSNGASAVEKALAEATEGVIRHGVKEPKARTPGAIRIATYNIENLFDRRCYTFAMLGQNVFTAPGRSFDRTGTAWRSEQFRAVGVPRGAWLGLTYRIGK